MLLGATGVKAARKYVGEIDPWGRPCIRFVRIGIVNSTKQIKIDGNTKLNDTCVIIDLN
jgi:hypothetical protein